ncbi:MAG: hypothetical protein V4702_03075 [Patescibacteria group bacterium]
MSKLKPREIVMDAVGESTTADVLYPQIIVNHEAVPLESEEQLKAWAVGAATVNALIKSSDRRAINDQLWRYCAAPDDYPLELRTIYGGSENPHSVDVLDWALPSLAIAAAMQRYGMSPSVSVLSADEASIRLNGLQAEATTQHTNDTLQLVERVGRRYYPSVDLEVGRLTWDELTAEPYSDDVDLLRSQQLGASVVKIVSGLEEMVQKRGGDIDSVSAYLGLHNTAYAIYTGKPTIKIAGASEERFTVIQRELAAAHSEITGTKDIDNKSCLVAGVIHDSPSTAPYYVQAGIKVPSVLERINGMDYPLDILAKEYGLGRVASRIAALNMNPQEGLV